MKDYATQFIGKEVTVEVDRPMGTFHPNNKGILYCQNYGFVPDTKAPDGKEVDAYVLGVFKPIKEFKGTCVAVVHRTNDEDDKLIVVPEEREFSDEQIIALVEFQERFFESELIRH